VCIKSHERYRRQTDDRRVVAYEAYVHVRKKMLEMASSKQKYAQSSIQWFLLRNINL